MKRKPKKKQKGKEQKTTTQKQGSGVDLSNPTTKKREQRGRLHRERANNKIHNKIEGAKKKNNQRENKRKEKHKEHCLANTPSPLTLPSAATHK